MELDYAFFAMQADVVEGGKLHVFGGDVSTFTFSHLPAAIPPLSLVMKFIVPPSDARNKHCLNLRLEDPTGESVELLPAGQEITALPNSFNPEWNSGSSVVIQLGLAFETAGVYRFSIFLDGIVVKTLPLYVLHKPTLGDDREALSGTPTG